MPGPLIPPDALSPQHLAAWFERATEGAFPAWQPEVLADRRERLAHITDPKPAAVLFALRFDESVPLAHQPALVLTQRPAHLKHHPGQISLPGGAAETGETPEQTAVREAYEEVGLASERLQLVGRLPPYLTVTGFVVTPVVGLLRGPAVFDPDPTEVSEVFEVPLPFLMDPANHQRRGLALESEQIEFFAMPYQQRFIWGATAAMIRNLYHFLYAAWTQCPSPETP
ncbi:MAG: hypothetical protein RL483_226 [Pseudomonadota bacterium]